MRFVKLLPFFIFVLFLSGCENQQTIITSLDERDANVIMVFLDSKGIKAKKIKESAAGGAGGTSTGPKFSIAVDQNHSIDAMAYLNQNGLPRQMGTTLLDLFAKQGLMSSDREEQIRYQAGLEQQIANTILLIDGVIGSNVQLSFPKASTTGEEPEGPQFVTAAVFVKHQGILEDPNSHLETKIKRLVSSSVHGLSIDNVTVISDRSRFTDISPANLNSQASTGPQDYVSIWSIVMSKQSAATFRFLFFTFLTVIIAITILLMWVIWKFYPVLSSSGGFRNLFSLKPITKETNDQEDDISSEEPPQV